MARPFLIALLTVAAVAWPASVAGLPLTGSPDLLPTTSGDAVGAVVDLAEPTLCRAFHVKATGVAGPVPDEAILWDPDDCVETWAVNHQAIIVCAATPLCGRDGAGSIGEGGAVVVATSCQYVMVVEQPGEWVPYDVMIDPHGCIRRFIDDVWPLWHAPIWADAEGNGYILL